MKRIRVALWIDVPSDYAWAEGAADIATRLPKGWVPVYGETADDPDFRQEDEINDICPVCAERVPEHGPDCLKGPGLVQGVVQWVLRQLRKFLP